MPDSAPKTAQAVLITGCSSGIGYQAAVTLQERGYQVYATARKPADVSRLQSLGLHAVTLDLDSHNSIETAVAEVLERSDGKLYGLFNNGGYGQAGAVEDLPTDVLRQQFETLFFGWHELTRRVIPVMRQQGEGRIIQNSSVLGFAAMPHRGAYNAAKFAIEGLSDTLRLELQGSNIHLSIIQPGPIRTRFRDNGLVHFKKNIDIVNSVHAEHYRTTLERLGKQSSTNRFTLEPDVVVDKLLHALQSPKPKIRYRVTTPTIAFSIAKRLLPGRALDKILATIP
jgi:NAD(P)-dependent dehydrogenase (short-subunit alcohol dehydrogenase family)